MGWLKGRRRRSYNTTGAVYKKKAKYKRGNRVCYKLQNKCGIKNYGYFDGDRGGHFYHLKCDGHRKEFMAKESDLDTDLINCGIPIAEEVILEALPLSYKSKKKSKKKKKKSKKKKKNSMNKKNYYY